MNLKEFDVETKIALGFVVFFYLYIIAQIIRWVI